MGWKMLPLVMLCTLTQPAIMLDLQNDKEIRFDKGARVQIIQVKSARTIVYCSGGYYEVDSKRLFCK